MEMSDANIRSTSARAKNTYPVYRCVDAVLRQGLRILPAWAWTERVALWWGYRFLPSARVVKLRTGASIHVVPTDYLQMLIYYLGTFEPHCVHYLKRCIDKGATVVDVGANIGALTLECSTAAGPAGRVVAIEAAPPHVRTLRRNLELNGMQNVTLIETAVGDSTGRATLTLQKGDNLGMFTLGPAAGDESYTVTVRPIDDLLDEHGVNTVHVMKMDIEGSEYRALRGAANTLARCKPVILIELNEVALNRSGSSADEVKQLLYAAGYRGWLIGRGTIQPIPEGQTTHSCDECLFIHGDNQALMRRLRLHA